MPSPVPLWPLLLLSIVTTKAVKHDPTVLGNDLPQLHIIAIDQDGDLNYPEITLHGKDLKNWSADEYDVKLTKFESSLDVDPSPSEKSDLCYRGKMDQRPKMGLPVTSEKPDVKWTGDYLKNMMDAIKAKKKALGEKKDLKIVIHIHGGMNDFKGAVQSAAHGYWIMEQNDPAIYPIFVCWDSEPLSCYWNHLCFDRSGYSLRGTNWEPLGYLTAPFFFIGDLGAGAIRSPSIAIEQGFNDFKTVSPQLYPETLNYVPMFEQLKSQIVTDAPNRPSRPGPFIHVMQGADNFTDGDGAWNAIKYTASLPLKAIAGGVINGLGPGAWSEMKRRVDLMFWKQEQMLSYYSGKSHGHTDPDCWPENLPRNLQHDGLITIEGKQSHRLGGLAFFLQQLKYQVLLAHPENTTLDWNSLPDIQIDGAGLKSDLDSIIDRQVRGKTLTAEQFDVLKSDVEDACQEHSSLSGKGYQVSLFGHSMGAIVINEMLKNQPDIRYDKIVYMAAACSVKDFQDSVIPYMEDNPDCRFYNLCLNPEAELRNIEINEIAPRGGLLSWINDIFETPADSRHRTYGQFVTAINTSNIIPDQIRGRVYMKAFGFGIHPVSGGSDPHFQEGFPHNHGEFNSYGQTSIPAFGGNKTAPDSPVQFKGNRPKTANPHGFWTEDFIWYDADRAPSPKLNPLTLQSPADPDLQPGKPVYLKAFNSAWRNYDDHPGSFPPQKVPVGYQATRASGKSSAKSPDCP